MRRTPTPSTPLSGVIDIFYSTMRDLEATQAFQQGDPAVLELRTQVLRTIADLEISRAAIAVKEPPQGSGSAKKPSRASNSAKKTDAPAP